MEGEETMNEIESIDRIIAPKPPPKRTMGYYLKKFYKRLFRRTLIYDNIAVEISYCRNINDCTCYETYKDEEYICRNCDKIMKNRFSNCLVLHPPNEICITCEHCGKYENNIFEYDVYKEFERVDEK